VLPCEPCWLELLELVLLGLVPELLPLSRCIEPLELLDPEPVAPWSRFRSQPTHMAAAANRIKIFFIIDLLCLVELSGPKLSSKHLYRKWGDAPTFVSRCFSYPAIRRDELRESTLRGYGLRRQSEAATPLWIHHRIPCFKHA